MRRFIWRTTADLLCEFSDNHWGLVKHCCIYSLDISDVKVQRVEVYTSNSSGWIHKLSGTQVKHQHFYKHQVSCVDAQTEDLQRRGLMVIHRDSQFLPSLDKLEKNLWQCHNIRLNLISCWKNQRNFYWGKNILKKKFKGIHTHTHLFNNIFLNKCYGYKRAWDHKSVWTCVLLHLYSVLTSPADQNVFV